MAGSVIFSSPLRSSWRFQMWSTELDAQAVARVDEAVAFADASPHPPPESLYDDVYVLGDQVRGWYSVDERSAGVHKGEDERAFVRDDGQRVDTEAEHGEVPQSLTRALQSQEEA